MSAHLRLTTYGRAREAFEMPKESEAPTQVLTVYLAKERHTSADSLLKPAARCAAFDIAMSPGVPGRLYIQPGIPKAPKWAAFFADTVEAGEFGRVSSSAALLVVPIAGRLVAVAFGHGRHLLAPRLVGGTLRTAGGSELD